VTFRFGSANAGQRINLPTHAVGADREGRFVFVLDPSAEEGIAVVRRVGVEIGDLTGDGLEILSGLEVGQQVVTAGVRRLQDGQRVKAPGPAPGP
jgi:hypothetical protein